MNEWTMNVNGRIHSLICLSHVQKHMSSYFTVDLVIQKALLNHDVTAYYNIAAKLLNCVEIMWYSNKKYIFGSFTRLNF